MHTCSFETASSVPRVHAICDHSLTVIRVSVMQSQAKATPGVFPIGAAEAQYEQELKAFIKQSGGEVGMSILGSVKKPESFPKNTRLKAFLQAHSNSFAVAGDKVSLK